VMGIETDVPTRDVLTWDTLNTTLSPGKCNAMLEVNHESSGPSSVCFQSRLSGTMLSSAMSRSVEMIRMGWTTKYQNAHPFEHLQDKL
jgi:hypothetical protein